LIQFLKKESRITLNIQDEKIYQSGNYNFYLGYTGPLGAANTSRSIKVDVANDELFCNDPVEMKVNNEYSDLNDEFRIMNYTIGEIISEKMRSLMQRTMPRDLYDVWYLFEKENYKIEDYIIEFKKKTEFKDLDPNELTKTILSKNEIFKRQWENHLVNQIKEIPDFDEVWRTLGKHWRKLDKIIKK
jgi:predicted nucleotidyltransferase component of viral defense system